MTESALPPLSVMVKDFVSVAVLLDRLILLKARLLVETASLLTAARAFPANKIAAITTSNATAARHDK